MQFTGERFLSNLNSAQIAYEHWHRYQYAGQFIAGKKVLDIACGEGYGADFFANTAYEVFGVDISPEAIGFAQKTYKRENLHFLEGSVENIPINGSAVFDVVTSFETIEHISDTLQRKFLLEVKRLLKPGGLFIISTPDKKNYSDDPDYKNKFHVKEFYREEFYNFLKEYFSFVSFLGQRVLGGSYIWPLFKETPSCLNYFLSFQEQKFIPSFGKNIEGIYMLVFCSENKLPTLPSSLQIDFQDRYFQEKNEEILILKDIVFNCQEELKRKLDFIFQQNKTLQEIYNSWSWKITKPLRFLLNIFIKK